MNYPFDWLSVSAFESKPDGTEEAVTRSKRSFLLVSAKSLVERD